MTGHRNLGKNKEIPYDDHTLAELIRDNQPGEPEQTPFVLIHKKTMVIKRLLLGNNRYSLM